MIICECGDSIDEHSVLLCGCLATKEQNNEDEQHFYRSCKCVLNRSTVEARYWAEYYKKKYQKLLSDTNLIESKNIKKAKV